MAKPVRRGPLISAGKRKGTSLAVEIMNRLAEAGIQPDHPEFTNWRKWNALCAEV